MKTTYFVCLWLTVGLVIATILSGCLNWMIATTVLTVILLVSVAICVILYFGFAKHKCPKCGLVFRGKKLEMFFAPHIPTKRKMTCPMCQEKLWCDDWFGKSKEKDENTWEIQVFFILKILE